MPALFHVFGRSKTLFDLCDLHQELPCSCYLVFSAA
jgi:hypothetical protein